MVVGVEWCQGVRKCQTESIGGAICYVSSNINQCHKCFESVRKCLVSCVGDQERASSYIQVSGSDWVGVSEFECQGTCWV